MLHTIHIDQSVHHLRHGHRSLLRAGDGHVFPVLSYIQRDEKETKRLAEPASYEQTAQVRDAKSQVKLIVHVSLNEETERCEREKRTFEI